MSRFAGCTVDQAEGCFERGDAAPGEIEDKVGRGGQGEGGEAEEEEQEQAEKEQVQARRLDEGERSAQEEREGLIRRGRADCALLARGGHQRSGEWELGRREVREGCARHPGQAEAGRTTDTSIFARCSTCKSSHGSATSPPPAIRALVGVTLCADSRRRRKEERTTGGCLRARPSEASFGARGLLRFPASLLPTSHSPACQPPIPARWPQRPCSVPYPAQQRASSLEPLHCEVLL